MFDEKEILEFWEKNRIFEKSVENRRLRRKGRSKKDFVFFEGPPTANGVPGVHHVEARSFKDVILRYKTMRGFFAPRRAGWDTHGLPVEVEVEKDLGLKSKKDIEKYGIAAFNKKCRESVWKYKELWEKLTARMGFWIDIEHPHITYENSYIEALWGIIKEFAKKKLLYTDYKVMPWCARCGTALSSHELAQGYEKISENSVFVKFKLKPPLNPLLIKEGKGEVYLLVWTTTPWTLPGNVALAINPKIEYVMLEAEGEKLIVAESRINVVGGEYKILKKLKGSELVGLEYEPLYSLAGYTLESYKVLGTDFVTTEDGTGVVHIAPAFGEDDFNLYQKSSNPNLAELVTVREDGRMTARNMPWSDKWFKDADPLIIENLKKRGLLFKTESYEHDYPFCWRCKNPLMYLARNSWWLDVNKVRDALKQNNQKINWHPEHIKNGRFGEWLKEKKNWAFSRERYWGTPLPVWRCEVCKKWEAVGSIDELQKRVKNFGNRYFVMRHGEAESNVKNIVNGNLDKNHYALTSRGQKQAETAASSMLKKKIKPDLIFSSPFLRAEQTAGIIGRKLGVDQQNIKIDPRFREVYWGIFDDADPSKYHAYYKNPLDEFEKAPPGGESFMDLKKRVWDALSEIESRYKNKTVLIISHEDAIWMLWTAAEGKNNKESLRENRRRNQFIKTGEFMELEVKNMPRDENLVLDLHKPFIDEIKLQCTCGGEMRRAQEVIDAWFDSGAMPFASSPPGFPADYITEAIDQTRGWFYTLLAVSTLLGRGAPYKNVISLGHVLDSEGKKMSKSLGNIVDPMALIEKHGADAVRWYFFTINQPWDSKLFKEDDVKNASRRFFMILWNVLQFWKMYNIAPLKVRGARGVINPKLLINKWVLAKLAEVTTSITKKLDAYDIVGAARDLENFIVEDVSRWYIRRIRDVMKAPTPEVGVPTSAKPSVGKNQETGSVLAHLLGEISKLLAPFAPFVSEKIWMELGNKNSVHLEDWREPTPHLPGLLAAMNEVRKIVGLALEARAKAGIKVRQPLEKLEIKDQKLKTKNEELLDLIKEEVNLKKIVFNQALMGEIRLDTNITPELREEGVLRDLIREIQAKRKEAGLKPKDKVVAALQLPKEIFEIARKNQKIIEKETSLKSAQLSESAALKILLK